METRSVLTQDWGAVAAGQVGGKQKGRSLLGTPYPYLWRSPVSPKACVCLSAGLADAT